MISERRGGIKKKDISKWEGKIGKSPTHSKLFYQGNYRPPHWLIITFENLTPTSPIVYATDTCIKKTNLYQHK